MPRIALLSNVNMNMVIRVLRRETEIWQAEGYGNELGTLMNPESSYAAFRPEYTFLVMDLMELLEHDLRPEAAGQRIAAWFESLESALRAETIYYVSDAWLWGPELSVLFDSGRKAALEQLWQRRLETLREAHGNVRILPYRQLPESLGEENTFSLKMWYMGKVLLSGEAQKRLCGLILEKLRAEERTPKKALLLDLDNTLWGGLAGENDVAPIELSEEHGGLAYKNLQRVILQMQRQGVLLAIVSKNNEQDALEILEGHPHMVLRADAFAAKRINWRPKHENIREIAAELNLGTDSFVFWDDNPAERQLVREMLPEVATPDFPQRPEELAAAMASIYREYFEKPTVTEEDLAKTAQYAANVERDRLKEETGSFEDYLRRLEIVTTREDPQKHVERLLQLANKTNQFNLTAKRYTRGQIEELLEDRRRLVYLYRVADRFGDNGIVAAAVVALGGIACGSGSAEAESGAAEVECIGGGSGSAEAESIGSGAASLSATVEELVMSCRVMGKNIEYGIMDDVEEDLRARGVERLRGIYLPTAKNQPVERLYEQLGYRRVTDRTAEREGSGDIKIYEMPLAEKPERVYYMEWRDAR